MFRSAEMEFLNLQIAEHLAHDVVEKLGKLGAVQFIDMNGEMTSFKRYYTPFIKRCDDLEKKISFFEEECKRTGVEPEDVNDEEFVTWKQNQMDTINATQKGLSLLDYWEAIINERHRDYVAVKSERDKIATALYGAVQRRFVIEKAAEFFEVSLADISLPGSGASMTSRAGLQGFTEMRDEPIDFGSDMAFRHIAGVVNSEDKASFERIIFRATLGHAVVKFADIPVELVDPTGSSSNKTVFTIFYRGNSLAPKLDRICTAFGARQHDIPNFADPAAVAASLEETKIAIRDGVAWLAQERATSGAALVHIGVLLKKWKLGIAREKAIFHTLNMFVRHPERGALAAQGWVLKASASAVHDALKQVHVTAAQGGRIQPYYIDTQSAKDAGVKTAPPTHFHTNRFTSVFQGVVNTYGIPRYQEANPALFTIVTFPFLYGVMFGDVGHAVVLFLMSLFMVLKEKQIMSKPIPEMLQMAFGGRYMLLLMGIFSIYCGGIYNDVFAKGASFFHSTWLFPLDAEGHPSKYGIRKSAEAVYPFGIDPAWHGADNSLLFFNSMKMKMSVILGITQMVAGLFLRLANAIYFKNTIDIFLECIPQLVFMIGLFGYMVAIIIVKWATDWTVPGSGSPPSLIDTLINIALKPGSVEEPLFEGQASFQLFILFLIVICIPIMLVGKPYFLAKQHKKAKHEEEQGLLNGSTGDSQLSLAHSSVSPAGTISLDVEGAHAEAKAHAEDDHHSFGGLFIHQAIETIEFVLGSISNTASYLRLWALSLAHSQLATVFWERVLDGMVEGGNPVMIYFGYAAFAGVSFGVLLIMDNLECFLHALRLHWVEFQNKFYRADGHKFIPFDFAAIGKPAKD